MRDCRSLADPIYRGSVGLKALSVATPRKVPLTLRSQILGSAVRLTEDCDRPSYPLYHLCRLYVIPVKLPNHAVTVHTLNTFYEAQTLE